MATLAKSQYGSSPLCVHIKIPQKKTVVQDFSCFLYTFPIAWGRIELFVKLPCLHLVFGSLFTPYPFFQWYLQSKDILSNQPITKQRPVTKHPCSAKITYVRTKKYFQVSSFLTHYQTFGLEKNCSIFFISVTNHQILVFGIRGLSGHICKKIE